MFNIFHTINVLFWIVFSFVPSAGLWWFFGPETFWQRLVCSVFCFFLWCFMVIVCAFGWVVVSEGIDKEEKRRDRLDAQRK